VRYRVTMSDAATGVRSDVVIECDPGDPLGSVLDLIAAEAARRGIGLQGRPTVGGVAPDPAQPVAASPLRDGAVLEWGGAGRGARDPFAAVPPGHVLTVLSGPSAGTRLALDGRTRLEIGRASTCDLVLADADVSRRHAAVQVREGGFEIVDLQSANGVVVGGTRVTHPHRLREGEPVQLGGSRVVLENAARARAALTRTADGVFLVNRRFPDRREPFRPPSVALPTPAPDDDSRGLPVLAMVLPLVLAVALAVFLHSYLYLLFGLLSPIMLGGNWWTERRRRRSREARQQGSYADKLRDARTRIEQAVDEEDAALRARFPDPDTVTRTALELRLVRLRREYGQAQLVGAV